MRRPPASWRRRAWGSGRWAQSARAGALYLGLAVLFTWPLALHLGHLLPASELGDTLLHVHRLWFVPRMLASGQVPYGWTDLIHFPDGTSQYLETLIPLLG